MGKSIKIVLVVLLGTLFLNSAAWAKHHKKKASPTSTPTTSTRISNPASSPDPPK
jgi:hypothetical protein